MFTLNPEVVISESLEAAFGLKTYIEIMDYAGHDGFTATGEFRTKFNGYYKVRQKRKQWYVTYYELMEEQRTHQRSFEDLLLIMYSVNRSIEVSFINKLMATIDPNLPIWDKYVIRNLGFERKWERLRSAEPKVRITEAGAIYQSITTQYEEFFSTQDGIACINKFDELLPNYTDKLTAVKKLDYLLWSKR